MDLSKLTAKQLDDLVREAQGLAAQKRTQEKKDLHDKVLGMIQDAGFSVEDLFPRAGTVSTPGKEKTPARVKYIDPENPDNKWSGRGRYPGWITKAKEEGIDIETYAVK